MRIFCFVLFCYFLASCKCRSSCSREGACRSYSIRQKSNDSLVLSETYCTKSVYAQRFQDSVNSLLAPFPLSDYIITYTDSAVTTESHVVSCDDVSYHEQEGFYCVSPK